MMAMAFKSIDLRFYSCILNDIGFLFLLTIQASVNQR